MMMDCPRCGFAQPKDRFCASCGLDVENYHAKPLPLVVRILQNPSFHLSLVAVLIVFVVGYILISRSQMMTSEVGHLLRGQPLSSRQAAEGEDLEKPPAPKPAPAALPKKTEVRVAAIEPKEQTQAAVAPGATGAFGVVTGGTAAQSLIEGVSTTPAPRKVELSFWEIGRDTLASQLSTAEKLGETNEGRSYFISDGIKAAEVLRAGGRRLTLDRSATFQNGSQIVVVTPPTTPEPFQFGLALQLAKIDAKQGSATLRWDSQLVLSQPETAQEMAAPGPSVKAVTESAMNGSRSFTSSNLVLLVIEPTNRHPRDEYLVKAGEGPWSIFSSEDFQRGATDWVALIQLK